MSRMKCVKWIAISSMLMVVVAVALGMTLSAAFGAAETTTTAAGAAGPGQAARPVNSLVAMAIALAVASGALGAGYAVGKVGSAAIGAASERPEMMGRALVFVVIAEGIAVWGLVGAILLIGALR